MLPAVVGLTLPRALAELKGMTEAVTFPGLDYTIAASPTPADKPAAGWIRSGFLGRDRVDSAKRARPPR